MAADVITRDPQLQNLVNTYAPTAAGPQFTVGENYANKNLRDIHNQLLKEGSQTGLGSLSTIASFLGISETQPLTAGQTFSAASIPQNYVGSSSEWQGLVNAFGQPTTPTSGNAPSQLPQPLNRVEQFEQLREQHGVADLETQLNDLKAAIEQEQAQLRTNIYDERGKPVAQGVIEGRISKQQQQVQEQIDFLGRQQNRIVDQLNTAYNVIGLYMNFADADYEDAVQRYESEFNRNLAIYGLIADARREESDERRYQQQLASANLQTYQNALLSGNLSYSDLSADQKAQIARLESQAGLPVGLTSSLRMNPSDQVLFQNTNGGITQVGFMDASGKVRVESYGTKTGGTGGGSSLIDLGTNKEGEWKVVGTGTPKNMSSQPNMSTLDIYNLWPDY